MFEYKGTSSVDLLRRTAASRSNWAHRQHGRRPSPTNSSSSLEPPAGPLDKWYQQNAPTLHVLSIRDWFLIKSFNSLAACCLIQDLRASARLQKKSVTWKLILLFERINLKLNICRQDVGECGLLSTQWALQRVTLTESSVYPRRTTDQFKTGRGKECGNNL